MGRFKIPTPKGKKLNPVTGIVVLVLIVLAFLGYETIPTALGVLTDDGQAGINSDFSIHFIDVGQGDSTLVMADGYNILIDGGEMDKGTDVVKYLNEQGIDELDMIVSSHPHSDHIGGLSTVIENIKVSQVLMFPVAESITPTSKSYTKLLKAIDKNDVKLVEAVVGDKITFGKAVFNVIGPVKKYDDLNNSSIILKMTYKGNTVLFTGDMESVAENDILANRDNVDCDVLKVAHHGSNSSSTEKFINAVSPDIAVISVGEDNSYSHPNKKVLKRLSECEIYRTDIDGTVVLTVKNGEFKLVS